MLKSKREKTTGRAAVGRTDVVGPRAEPPSVDQRQLSHISSPLSSEALRRRDLGGIDCTTQRLP